MLLAAVAACSTASSDSEPVPTTVAIAQLSPGTTPPPAIVDAIKAAAAKALKDPHSAKWERMQRATRPNVRGEPTDVVCGYVNAKNSFGGYIGSKPFLYFVARQELNGPDDRFGVLPDMLKTFCSGLI